MINLNLISNGSAAELAKAVAALDDPGRAAAFKALEAYAKRTAEESRRGEANTALAVATVGTAPSAAAAARLLRPRHFTPIPSSAPAVVATARTRGVPWLPDLAARLADRRSDNLWDGFWEFVAALFTAEGSPPPPGDWFVLGWLLSLSYPGEGRLRSTPIAERLRTDPFLDALLPRVFTVDGAGERLLVWEVRGRPGGKLALVEALAELSAEGRLDRTTLIAATLSRLLRGDRLAATRAYLTLLTALSPTPQEVTNAGGDYLRLLADAQVTVATAAQKALRTAETLDLDAVLEASRAVLRRPDKTLVRTQLTWLETLIRRHPSRKPDIVRTLAEALDHPAIDLRERAAALIAKHTPAPPPATLSETAATATAAATIPAVLTTVSGDDLPLTPPSLPAPPPIADPDELAEEVAAFYSDRPFSALLPLERILDGTVRLAAAGHPALRAALSPVMERHREGMGDHTWDPNCLCGAFTRLLLSAADPAQAAAPNAERHGWAALLTAARRFLPLGEAPPDRRIPPPQRLLRARLAEIGVHLAGGDLPAGGLLSAPESSNGALTTETLLARLTARGEREPWPWDLAQAMLRLPPGPDPTAAARSEALGTAAGARLATWLHSGGLPTPRWQVNVWTRPPLKPRDQYRFGNLPTVRIEVTTAPPGLRPTPLPNPHPTAPPPQSPASPTATLAPDSAAPPPRSSASPDPRSAAPPQSPASRTATLAPDSAAPPPQSPASRTATLTPDSAAPPPRSSASPDPLSAAPRTASAVTDSRPAPVLDDRDVAEAAAGRETFGLLGAPPPPIGTGSGGWHRLWPGILPWHRGLVAGFALADAAATADMDQRGGAGVLPLLAETAGDGGPALPIAVAYALAARHEADRLAAVDALLLLAADGAFDAETAGRYLGLLATAGAVTVNRAVQPLRDAAGAGARLSVFRLLAAALPALLGAEPPPRGTPDLLTLAAETAAAGPGRVEIAGLAELTARKGSSRLVVEARRLAKAVS
ncbi:DUF6493 family protein [Dactylosporangium sp. McL0621]|uniref:DUF6493 family protein n=1 Tax=Dactylosporangium sp. McL0621 TaxID=3415678 RepID=UPI003CF009BE